MEKFGLSIAISIRFFHTVETFLPYRGKIAKKFSMLWKTVRAPLC